MKPTAFYYIAIILFISSTIAVHVHANDDLKPTPQEKNSFYKVLNTVKKAMPAAPEGWAVAGESNLDSLAKLENDGANQSYRFTYQIQYKRISGIKEEKKRLNEIYAESSERHGEEANAQINDLLKQQTATSLALRKATRHNNQAEIQRLNDDLEENGRKMHAIHEDVDNKISHDVEQYLLKDTEASIDIIVNDERAEDVFGEPIPVSEAAFAFRREGERKGPMIWQEGKTVILFGNWHQIGIGSFRGDVLHRSEDRKIQTIKITISGARNRAMELLNQMDRKAIHSLIN
jgi:hypothetical protein